MLQGFIRPRRYSKHGRVESTIVRAWNSVGFHSPAMLHNLYWTYDLELEYDSLTFAIDLFEPQSDGVDTIYSFWVAGDSHKGGCVELPYTLAQDSTLFVLMKEKDVDLWKQKLDWIAEKTNMTLLRTPPHYMYFDGNMSDMEEYAAEYYREFFDYIKTKYGGQY